ncbi:MAG TPA: protein kinase [Burkholderiales bacterium]|nr:protein kinase [Burkholderiales bacterium]
MSTDRSDEHDLTIASSGLTDAGENVLPPGAKIAEFRIERLIGEGGFGIVYLAYDESLDRTIALKEYMPSQLAERVAGTASVRVRSQRYADTFDAALRSFINEAKLLARFDHPSLLKVYRFFQANGTAYMAMPFYEGQTLKAVLRGLDGPPDERWLRHMLYQLLDGLEVIHAYECYHRDIAPDNILLQNDTPILLDFGAARRVIGDITRTLTVILKPGYAPIEQYGEDPNLKQGAWTDIYALAGVVHFALTRQAPPASIARAMSDQLVPLAQRLRGVYSDGFLTTIDAALSVRPQDRPQSVAQLRSMLLASDTGAYAPVLAIQPLAAPAEASRGDDANPPPVTGRDEARPAPAKPRKPVASSASPLRAAITAIAFAAPAAIAAVWWASSRLAEPPATEAKARVSAVEESPPKQPENPPQQAAPTVAAAPKAPEPPPAPKAEPTKPAVEVARVEPKSPVTPPPRVDTAKAKAPEPAKPSAVAEAKPAPVAPAPPRPAARAEETVEAPPAPKPPPQQVARVEPPPVPAPAPAPKAEAPKPAVEVARVEAKPAPAPHPAAPALTGRYSGRLVADGSPVPITLQILAVDNGSVSATANYGTGRCEGDYRMTGTVLNDSLRMRSTHSGGRYGDCSFGFRVAIQGTKLVGQTTSGSPLELSR